MSLSSETLAIFLLLIPGFLASVVLDAVVVRKKKELPSRIIEALVLSFVIYVCSTLFLRRDVQTLTFSSAGIEYSGTDLAVTLAFALLVPLFVGSSVTNDWHMGLLRFLGVTDRTSRDAVWLDVFTSQKSYVIVNFTDGKRLWGWPQYYSDDAEQGCLYLHDPAWVQEDGTYLDLERGIFIVKPEIIETIEFTNTDSTNAKPKPKQVTHVGEEEQPA